MTVDGSCAEERVFIYSEMQQCSFRMRFHAGCTPLTPTHTHTRTHTPPVFLISTLTLQSPGLIKKGKCVIAEEGLGLLRGRAGCIVQEAGPGYSRRRAHSARLPAWPRRRYQSQHRSLREKELGALGMHDLTQIARRCYRTWETAIKVKRVAV